MPVSSFHGLQTSLRGILAHQRAIDVTGHNVANADTIGYSRQQASLGTVQPLRIGAGATTDGSSALLGAGVAIQDYSRVRDSFLDLQYRAQNMRLGEQQTLSRSLDELEFAFQEPGPNGIGALTSKFWDAWSDVSNAPESSAPRNALVERAKTVSAAFVNLDSQLAAVGAQADGDYQAITVAGGQVSSIASQISQLNDQIKSGVASGEVPNDLLDRRDMLLDELSGLAQVSVANLSGGSIQVKFGDAAALLVDDTAVTWPQTLSAPGGKLGALLKLSNPTGTVASYRADLATAARTFADSVNNAHVNPATVPPTLPFFSATAGNEAATLAVNVTPAQVRTSSTPGVGGNDIARRISELRGGSPDQSYQAFISRVGTEVQEARRLQKNAAVLAGAVDERRMSTSGVSLDEEMTNLVRFQRGFQASARTMSTMDEMLDTIINRTGRVGL